MKEHRSIIKENIPCWYELCWRAKKPALVLKIYKEFISNAKSLPVFEDSPIVKSLKEEFKFKKFVGNFSKNFGFDNAFIKESEDEDCITFVAKIPIIKKLLEIKCKYCNGSGKERAFIGMHGACLSCEGTGKTIDFDWRVADAISANFTILTSFVNPPETETSSQFLQLMTINTITGRGFSGLKGEYSIPLVKWLSLLSETESITEVVDAMRIADNRMFGSCTDRHRFLTFVDSKSGWLNISCPGERCGLAPSHGSTGYYAQKGLGYMFNCHNLDTSAQQITLLAGLSALNDKARKEGL